jgi:DNA-binding protein HU-beta
MKKFELVDVVSDACGHPRVAVRAVLDATADSVRAAIARGEEVRLFGLGKLSVSSRGPKKARNIHTGEPITVPARKAALFQPSTALEDAARNSASPQEGRGQ